MYMSLSLGMIIILLPLLLLAFLIAVGVVLYRHPSKLQKKWYQVSLKKRRRVKQAGIFLGFCAAAALFIYPLVNGEKFVSTIRLSAKERNLITKNKIKKTADESSKAGTAKNDKWLKSLYKIIRSDDTIAAQFLSNSSSYDEWASNIGIGSTGEYEMRLFAENVVADKFAEKKSDEDIDSDEDFDSYDDTGFYKIIQRPDNTLEENYQKLTDSEKQDVRALKWHYKDGLLYATDDEHKVCINGTAQISMKDTKLINMMEKSGYKGIKKWMEQCENDQAGIKVKAGNKTYLLHNTDKWHKFEKNVLSIFYNYKRFIIRFDANKILGIKSNLSELPQSGRALWTVIADQSGASSKEIILRSYNDEGLYAKKNVQIFMKDHKIKQLLIYWDKADELKGFTKEENIFMKACFEKMGIASEDAQKWLEEFNSVSLSKKNAQNGELGNWTYSYGNSENQIVSLVDSDHDDNYVNFYKKSKGNN